MKCNEDGNDMDDDDDDDSTTSTTAVLRNGSIDVSSIDCTTHTKIPICAPAPRIIVHHHYPIFESDSRHMTNDPILKEMRRRKYFEEERKMKPMIEADFASSCKVR